MLELVYVSHYTTYTAGFYPDLAACIEDIGTRFEMEAVAFGQDDAGTLYTTFYADDGIVVLKVYEVDAKSVTWTRNYPTRA